MHFSSLGSNPVSLFTLRGGRWLLLAVPQFLSHHCGVAAFSRLEVWEPSFTVWGQKSLMAAIFLVYWNGRKYFHFIKLSVLSIQFYCEPKAAVKHNAYIQKYPWKPWAQIFIDLHNFFQGNNSCSFRVKNSFKIAFFFFFAASKQVKCFKITYMHSLKNYITSINFWEILYINLCEKT